MQPVHLPESRDISASPDADAASLTAIAGGDREAFARLYALYQRRLFRYLYQLAQDRGLAEEMLQDTFVAVWRGACRFQERSSVQTWLFGVARRQAHNSLRKRRRDLVDGSCLEAVADVRPGPEGRAISSDDRRALIAALTQVSPIQREALSLVFIEGFSYRETAEILGVPEGTVKSRISNARLALRGALATPLNPNIGVRV